MTEKVVAEVRRIARPDVQVRGVTAIEGPAVVASRETFAQGAESGLRTLLEQPGWADAVLLACFAGLPPRGRVLDLCTGNGVVPLQAAYGVTKALTEAFGGLS